ncbi:MAG: hypothetical protein KAG98_03855 [Lentisphaeria bacterium]|nr:hypothetical protein [Lentisphaeria bacterium]
MVALLKTGTLIQKNFWLCLMLVSLSFTFLGATKVTVEVLDRSERTLDYDCKFKVWCQSIKSTLSSNVRKSFEQLSRNEKELLYLNTR